MHLSGSLPEGECPVSVRRLLIVRSSLLKDCVRLSGSLPEGERSTTVRPTLIVRSSLLADCVCLSGSLPEGERPVNCEFSIASCKGVATSRIVSASCSLPEVEHPVPDGLM